MSHAGLSSFFGMFKETALACIFDLGGLIAGFMIADQLGVFQLSPWAIALYPAIISVKAVISGLLTGRLSTALHLGTAYPKLFGNTKNFYGLIQAMVVLTLATSATISVIAIAFGTMFWGITVAEFPAILSVVVATLSLGLLTTLITVKLTFFSFKKGLDTDTIVYPASSIVSNIVLTVIYIGVLNLYFHGDFGRLTILLFGLINVLLVLTILPVGIRNTDFTRTLKESVGTMLLVALMVNITGTFFKGVNDLAMGRRDIYIFYPAVIDMMGDAGFVVGSSATSKLALGVLTPNFSSIKNHAKSILGAWTASLLLFMIAGLLAVAINGMFSLQDVSNLLLILLVTNLIAFTAIVLSSFVGSILTFKRGLDPDNFVIPVQSSLADALTTTALFAALLLIV